jgi:hypothetical protein
MFTNIKALVFILGAAIIVFMLAKPICLRFMTETDFCRRRNVWLVLTVTAFLSPSFWLYALVALPLMFWAGRKDGNPVALYALLFQVIPPYSVEIPPIIINRIFDVNNYRLLAVAILLPVAWRFLTSKKKTAFKGFKAIDGFMWSYFALQLVLLLPNEEITNTFRRAFLKLLDDILLLYVVTRSCMERKKIIEVMLLYCLANGIMALIAVVESHKHWLVYTQLASIWNISISVPLMRDGDLRAQASAGHSLALGYLLALAFGFWLYISSHVPSRSKRIIGSIGVWMGLIAALSRAPWITAVLTYFAYVTFSPNGITKLLKAILVTIPVAGLVLISPIGQKIIDKLPFVGTVDTENVDYRERLAETSWELIKQNPFFGDIFFLDHMEHMRQGEGIIDLVNVYAATALPYGVVGLLLFLGPFVLGAVSTWKVSRNSANLDIDLSLLGACLLACMLGIAFFMVTGSFDGVMPKAYYLLTGLAAAYGQLQQTVPNQYASGNK